MVAMLRLRPQLLAALSSHSSSASLPWELTPKYALCVIALLGLGPNPLRSCSMHTSECHKATLMFFCQQQNTGKLQAALEMFEATPWWRWHELFIKQAWLPQLITIYPGWIFFLVLMMRGWGFVSAASRACEGIRSHSNLSFSASSANNRREVPIRSCSVCIYIYTYSPDVFLWALDQSNLASLTCSRNFHHFPSSLLQIQLLLSTLQMLLLYAKKICYTSISKYDKIRLDRQTHVEVLGQTDMFVFWAFLGQVAFAFEQGLWRVPQLVSTFVSQFPVVVWGKWLLLCCGCVVGLFLVQIKNHRSSKWKMGEDQSGPKML